MMRAGLEQAFQLKVLQYRLKSCTTGNLSNEVTVECIRNIVHNTEATENKRAGTNASALTSGKQPSANALAATPAPVGKDKPHDATRATASSSRSRSRTAGAIGSSSSLTSGACSRKAATGSAGTAAMASTGTRTARRS